jgi:iron-sulfur cluster assembly protein
MITISDNAVEAIREAMKKEQLEPEVAYLRVGVKGGGCSGFTYTLTFDTEERAGDSTIEKDGVRLVIDLKSQLYLAGTTLDFSSGLNGKGFVFINPNAKGTCGCGESFSV